MTTAKRGALLDVVSRWALRIPNRGVLKDWGCFKANSIFRVEQEIFPPGLPDWTGGKYPCTDGETVCVPHGPVEACISILLHETAHALLHYANGPDPSFEDPDTGFASLLEAEACAAAYLAAVALGQAPLYNKSYLEVWEGDVETFKRDSKEKVMKAATRIADRYSDSKMRFNGIRESAMAAKGA